MAGVPTAKRAGAWSLLPAGIALGVVLTGALVAQNANTPPTLQTFSFERVLDPKQVLSTLTPNIPPVR